jgi:hypothetical protein
MIEQIIQEYAKITIPDPKIIIEDKDLEEVTNLISFFSIKSNSINLLILLFSIPKKTPCTFLNIKKKKNY